MPFHCFLASLVTENNAAIVSFFSFFLFEKSLFFSCCLQDFFSFWLFVCLFVLFSCSFTVMYLGGHFCPYLLAFFLILWNSWGFDLVFITNLKKNLTIISINTLFTAPFVFYGIPFACLFNSLILSHSFWMLCSDLFFTLFSSFCVSICIIFLNYFQIHWFFFPLCWVYWWAH